MERCFHLWALGLVKTREDRWVGKSIKIAREVYFIPHWSCTIPAISQVHHHQHHYHFFHHVMCVWMCKLRRSICIASECVTDVWSGYMCTFVHEMCKVWLCILNCTKLSEPGDWWYQLLITKSSQSIQILVLCRECFELCRHEYFCLMIVDGSGVFF